MIYIMKSILAYRPLVLSVLFSIGLMMSAQGVWYFGGSDAFGNASNDVAGVDFNGLTPLSLAGGEGQLASYEGCATLSDNHGKILCYTDGLNVYDQTHQVMPNGSGLFGSHSSTQSSIIGPMPGRTDAFYIFTNKSLNNTSQVGFNGLSYSTVDFTLMGNGSTCPLGDIVSNEKNIPLVDSTNEKVAIVPHMNGTDYWVITQSGKWNNIYAFLVDAGGVWNTPIVSSSPFWGGVVGQMKVSPDGSLIAVAQLVMNDPDLSYPGGLVNTKSELQLLRFDRFSGTVNSNYCYKLDSTDTANFGFYGVEFSPDGKYLYANVFDGSAGQVLQFDIQESISNGPSRKIVGSGMNVALQLGPDGKIYQARANQSALDVIHFPNEEGVDCQFESSGLSLGSGVCQMGLPNQPTPGLSMPVNINTPIISNKDSVYCLTDMPVEVLSDIGDFWYSDQNLQYEVGQGQSFFPDTSSMFKTYYVIDVTNNCFSGPDSVRLKFIDCTNSIFIPSAFTPNSDGVNDIIRVYSSSISDMDLHIYDRWGNQVYISQSQLDSWDGYYNGALLESAVYMYRLEVYFENGHYDVFSGNITLVR